MYCVPSGYQVHSSKLELVPAGREVQCSGEERQVHTVSDSDKVGQPASCRDAEEGPSTSACRGTGSHSVLARGCITVGGVRLGTQPCQDAGPRGSIPAGLTLASPAPASPSPPDVQVSPNLHSLQEPLLAGPAGLSTPLGPAGIRVRC